MQVGVLAGLELQKGAISRRLAICKNETFAFLLTRATRMEPSYETKQTNYLDTVDAITHFGIHSYIDRTYFGRKYAHPIRCALTVQMHGFHVVELKQLLMLKSYKFISTDYFL